VKFKCERDVLAEALGAASRASTGRATNPTLSCLRLVLADEMLRITGTDGDLTIEASVLVAKPQEGVALIPAKLASDVVRSLSPGAVDVEIKDGQVRISAGKSQFSLPTGADGDFPKWAGTIGGGATIPSSELAVALKQVVKAASTDDARGVLTGVLLTGVDGKLRLVATDSYRLAIRDVKGKVVDEGTRVVVPARALSELQRLLSFNDTVSINITDNDVTFEVGPIRLVTRLIAGTFADYQKLIPTTSPNRLTVSRDELLEAVRRVKLVARDPVGTPLRMKMSSDGVSLRMMSQDSGEGKEQLDATLKGDEIEMAFNNELLAEGIEACASENVTIDSSDPGKLAVIRGEGDDTFIYLLMPLKS